MHSILLFFFHLNFNLQILYLHKNQYRLKRTIISLPLLLLLLLFPSSILNQNWFLFAANNKRYSSAYQSLISQPYLCPLLFSIIFALCSFFPSHTNGVVSMIYRSSGSVASNRVQHISPIICLHLLCTIVVKNFEWCKTTKKESEFVCVDGLTTTRARQSPDFKTWRWWWWWCQVQLHEIYTDSQPRFLHLYDNSTRTAHNLFNFQFYAKNIYYVWWPRISNIQWERGVLARVGSSHKGCMPSPLSHLFIVVYFTFFSSLTTCTLFFTFQWWLYIQLWTRKRNGHIYS